MYEDPTYLGFELKFDSDNSPLFNFGDYPPKAIESPIINNKKGDLTSEIEKTDTEKEEQEKQNKKIETTNQTYNYNGASAFSFIRKYGSHIPEIKKREIIYYNFINNLDKIFNRTNLEKNIFSKSYYIETITGLDKLPAKMVKYEDDKITIQLNEDVSLRTTYLAELYNNLIYSYKNQRTLIPENCLRFDMMISITDMRIFKHLENIDGELISKINTDPPRIIYTLHDCNFDFSKSIPFQSTLVVGGKSTAAITTNHIITFDIKYKSISKNFRTILIPKSLEINNKLNKLINSKILNRTELFDYNITSNDIIISNQKKDDISNNEHIIVENDLFKNIGENLKESLIDNLDNYKNKLTTKYNDIRGELLQDLITGIRKPMNLPEIYPDNVYSADFRSLSLESFAKGLGSDLLNDGLNGLSDGLLSSTNL
jgi:hypothetical protein